MMLLEQGGYEAPLLLCNLRGSLCMCNDVVCPAQRHVPKLEARPQKIHAYVQIHYLKRQKKIQINCLMHLRVMMNNCLSGIGVRY